MMFATTDTLETRISAATMDLAADMEQRCREVGLYHLQRGAAIPDWVFDDLEWVLRHGGT